jgi:transcriptional regulator with XRE-family HTH domain
MPPVNYIGARLRGRGISQRELAKAAKITEAYLSELVAGRKSNPSIAVLLKIAAYLDCHIEDLFKKPK